MLQLFILIVNVIFENWNLQLNMFRSLSSGMAVGYIGIFISKSHYPSHRWLDVGKLFFLSKTEKHFRTHLTPPCRPPSQSQHYWCSKMNHTPFRNCEILNSIFHQISICIFDLRHRLQNRGELANIFWPTKCHFHHRTTIHASLHTIQFSFDSSDTADGVCLFNFVSVFRLLLPFLSAANFSFVHLLTVYRLVDSPVGGFPFILAPPRARCI